MVRVMTFLTVREGKVAFVSISIRLLVAVLCDARPGSEREEEEGGKQGDRQPASGYPYRTDTQTTAAAPRAEEQKRGGLQSHDKTQADVIIDGDVQFPRIFVLLFCSILSSHPIPPSLAIYRSR